MYYMYIVGLCLELCVFVIGYYGVLWCCFMVFFLSCKVFKMLVQFVTESVSFTLFLQSTPVSLCGPVHGSDCCAELRLVLFNNGVYAQR